MNKRSILVFCALFLGSSLYGDEALAPDKLDLGLECIHVVSQFPEVAYLTAYAYSGEPVWEVNFNSEILSWKTKDQQLVIFSKARNGQAYFLTCLDASNGDLIWENPIFGPPGSTE